ncbi:MAG: D-alanine--D-alanine ligase, partial [Leptospiraceae bacterium]|nr:D-alanine--D-alanine ligase [Leptospiraceae bacterium]
MIRVFLLFGGKSTEHFISLKTGSFIFRTLDRTKYKVKPILITEKGSWLIPKDYPNSLPEISANINSVVYEKLFRERPIDEVYLPNSLDCDIVFLGLHGGEGENGTIQAFLELLRVPYTGSKVLASALAMDKEKSNYIYKANGLNVANFTTYTKKEFSFLSETEIQKRLTQKEISFPCFVKPNNGGSSVGAGIANNILELKERLQTVFDIDNKAVVQNLLKGTEVSCGVIEFKNEKGFIARPLYPTQILPKSEFFDFEAKYKKGGSKEITP